MEESVVDYVTPEGQWDFFKISQVLDQDCMELFVPLKPPEENLGKDRIAWLLTSSGEFTIKTACECYADQNHNANEKLFKQIWQVLAPQRVRSFLWLVANDALLTNVNIVRRHIAHDTTRVLCGTYEESLLHIIRDCFVAQNIWISIEASLVQSDFFDQSLQEWLTWNLSSQTRSVYGVPWPLFFAACCMLLWRSGNSFIFEGVQMDTQQLFHWIIWTAKDYNMAQNIVLVAKEKAAGFHVKQIGWTPPPCSWVKINTDGSVLNNSNAACGGLIRDHHGGFLSGFSANLGMCTITFAELWGMYLGLKEAKTLGVQRVML